MILSLLFVILVVGKVSSSNATMGMLPTPVSKFEFTRQQCINNNFVSSGLIPLDLSRDENVTRCSPGMGVESLASFSAEANPAAPWLYLNQESTMQEFFNRFQTKASGISVELWFYPLILEGNSPDSRLQPIFTLGSSGMNGNSTGTYPGYNECDQQRIDFQLSQQGSNLQLLLRTSDPYYEPCYRKQLLDLTLDHETMNHVVITLRDRQQQIFINGKLAITLGEPFDSGLQHWNRNDDLRFFSYPNGVPWHGRLYQLSIFDTVLDDTNVLMLLAAGLPPSQPYGISKIVTVNEDAELAAGSHNADWYAKPQTFNSGLVSPKIPLTIGSVDLEVLSFLQSINITELPSPSFFVYITRLPDRGDLYQMEGSKISGGLGAALLLTADAVVFLPVPNEHSALPGATYASFDYCVVDHEIFAASQCEPATVSIVVSAVNDPPMPLADPNNAFVQEGNQNQVIQLYGSDIDGDLIEAVNITMPPLLGDLVLSVSSFRSDGILDGTPLSDINFTVGGQVAYVEYRFRGSDHIVQNGSITDSFRFRVSDSNGAWSTEKSVAIHIVPGVIALPPSNTVILENTKGIIQLNGMDESKRTIAFFMESVPPANEGLLLDSSNTTLQAGVMVAGLEDAPYVNGVNVTFEPAAGFCTTDTLRNTTFSYRAVALVGDRIVSISSVMTNTLRVQCILDPIILMLPDRKFDIQTFEGSLADPCSGYIFNASEVSPDSCPSAAIISGIKVSYRNPHPELATVSIRVNNGLLTLNRNYWQDVFPISGQEEARSSIAFLALPENLNSIFSYLHYQSFVPGEDVVEIFIGYGSGCNVSNGNLMLNDTNCQEAYGSIPILLKPNSLPSHQAYLFRNFQWIPLPFTMILLLFIKVRGKTRRNVLREMEGCKPSSKPKGEERSVGSTIDEDTSVSVRWIQFYDAESGFYYYQNTDDGSVTWEPPLDEDFIPAEH